MPDPRRPAGRLWRFALGLVLAAGFGWLFARELDWEAVGGAIRGVSPGALLVTTGFLVFGWGCRIVRWWWLLRPAAPGLPLAACAGPFLAGMAGNNLLPFRAGDALRVTGYRRQLRSPLMRVAGTLAIERALDVAVLAGVFFFCLLGVPEGHFSGEVIAGAALLAGLSGAAIIAVSLFPSQLELLAQRFAARAGARTETLAPASSPSGDRTRPLARLLRAASRHGAHLGESLRALRSRSQTLGLLGLSGLAWFCEGAAFWVMATAIETGSAPAGPWLAVAVGTLATALPSTPGYLGTFHYFVAQGLAAYGAGPAEAAAFALTVHAWFWITSTVFGSVFLLQAAGSGGLFGKAPRRGGGRGKRPGPGREG